MWKSFCNSWAWHETFLYKGMIFTFFLWKFYHCTYIVLITERGNYAENLGVMIHTARVSRFFHRPSAILYLAIMFIHRNEILLIQLLTEYFRTGQKLTTKYINFQLLLEASWKYKSKWRKVQTYISILFSLFPKTGIKAIMFHFHCFLPQNGLYAIDIISWGPYIQ